MFRVSALTGLVLIGLSAGVAPAQQIIPVTFGPHTPGVVTQGCPPQDCTLIAVPCEKHECCVKSFLDKLFGLKKCKTTKAPRVKPCAPVCGPTCAPTCVPACPAPCPVACAPAPVCPPPAPPAPKCVAVPVKLMLLCRVPQPAPCPQPCVPACQPQSCVPACQPTCPPGCVPMSCNQCGHKFLGNGLFRRHHTPACQPTCTPACSTCGETPTPIPAAQPATLPPSTVNPTAMDPTYPSNGYTATQTMPQAADNPYSQLIATIQASQERESKLLREMLETRAATQAVVRALQASDANNVELFEKMLQQMKGAPALPTAPTAAVPTSTVPPIVAPAIPGTSLAVPASRNTLAVDEMKSILRELQSPTPAVRTASAGN